MTRTVTVSVCAIASLLLAPLGASAQSRSIEMSPSDHVRHGDQGARPGPPVHDLYPSRPVAPDTVGFVAPLSKETATGRAGVGGWTAANVPAGSRGAADPDNAGWLGFGFAVQWGGAAARARN